MTGVRWRADTGFEGKCDVCLEWWPLDPSCWSQSNGLRRCRACISEGQAARNRVRREDPAVRAMDRAGVQAARAASKADARRAYYRENYRKNRERVNRLARERYAAKQRGDAERVRKRDWMRAFRERQAELEAA